MAEYEEISDPDRESMVHEISDNITAGGHSSSSASSASKSEEKVARSPPHIKAKTDPFLYHEKPETKAFGGGGQREFLTLCNDRFCTSILSFEVVFFFFLWRR